MAQRGHSFLRAARGGLCTVLLPGLLFLGCACPERVTLRAVREAIGVIAPEYRQYVEEEYRRRLELLPGSLEHASMMRATKLRTVLLLERAVE